MRRKMILLCFISDSDVGTGDEKVPLESAFLRMEIRTGHCQKHTQ